MTEFPDTEAAEEARSELLELRGEWAARELEEVGKVPPGPSRAKRLHLLIEESRGTEAATKAEKLLSEMFDDLLAQARDRSYSGKHVPQWRDLAKELPGTETARRATRLADEIVFLHQGSVVESGDAGSFFERPLTQTAAAFLQGRLLW